MNIFISELKKPANHRIPCLFNPTTPDGLGSLFESLCFYDSQETMVESALRKFQVANMDAPADADDEMAEPAEQEESEEEIQEVDEPLEEQTEESLFKHAYNDHVNFIEFCLARSQPIPIKHESTSSRPGLSAWC